MPPTFAEELAEGHRLAETRWANAFAHPYEEPHALNPERQLRAQHLHQAGGSEEG
jgi:hypothetical protein